MMKFTGEFRKRSSGFELLYVYRELIPEYFPPTSDLVLPEGDPTTAESKVSEDNHVEPSRS